MLTPYSMMQLSILFLVSKVQQSAPHILRVILNFHQKNDLKFSNSFSLPSAAEFMRHTLIPIINVMRDRILLIPISSGNELFGEFSVLK